jgi:hypothetical protein
MKLDLTDEEIDALRSAAPRHNRRRPLPVFAAGQNVEWHSRQDPTRGKTRTVAAP